MSSALAATTAAVEGDGRLAGISRAALLSRACLPLPCAKPITVSMGGPNPASADAPPSLRAMRLAMIPNSAPCEPTSGPPLAPLLTAAVNCNSLNPCPAPGMSSASRRAAMIRLPALHARPLELDTRCGIDGGNSALVTWLDERVMARAGQNVAVGRPPKVSQFGENDLSRNSPAQAYRDATRPRHLRASYPRAPAILLVA
jgi:hypothetical protein